MDFFERVYGIYADCERHSRIRSILKNGKFGKRIVELCYSKLQFCDFCKKHGGPKKIQYRPHEHRTLCMSCWNKLRPIQKALNETEATKSLIRKLDKERLNGKRLCGNNGGIA